MQKDRTTHLRTLSRFSMILADKQFLHEQTYPVHICNDAESNRIISGENFSSLKSKLPLSVVFHRRISVDGFEWGERKSLANKFCHISIIACIFFIFQQLGWMKFFLILVKPRFFIKFTRWTKYCSVYKFWFILNVDREESLSHYV